MFIFCVQFSKLEFVASLLPYCLLHQAAFIKAAQKAEIVTG